MIGRRIGSYEIVAKLGAGGMGEVYRAHDTTLNRDVAIKVLPESFARDLDPSAGSGSARAKSRAERLARFKREAESLAALNHPHVAQVYGFDTSGDTRAIVMELVPGRPLSDHIGASGLPIDEVLAIARQVALALEAAHERDIVHRDLKPANIMVRDDGVVKVLDFGLAKAIGPEGVSATAETLTSPAHTAIGLILGTASYMAPEQARGKPVDRRADLWAFGCVVYEMLTGRSPFRGEDVQQTLANVLNASPDFTALPPATPASIRRLLRRCLTKDRSDRLADAASARLEIDDAIKEPSRDDGGTRSIASSSPWWWRPVLWTAAAAVAAIGFAAVLWMWPSATGTPASIVTRLDVTVPIGDDFADWPDAGGPALAVDGRTVFYVARRAGVSHVFRRRLDEVNTEIVPGTEGAQRLFVYPSGDWLGFTTMRPPTLKRVPVAGGPATTVFEAKANVLGIALTSTGEMVFGDHSNGLFRIPASGGEPQLLLPIGDAGPLRYPDALPGNRGLLFTVGGVPVGNRIAVLPAGATTPRFLTSGTDARYLPTGHVVFWRAGSLFAAAFDLDRLELVGDAVPVVEGVTVRGTGSGSFAVSPNGTLAYVNAVEAPARTLVWVDRQGGETVLKGAPGPYAVPRLSADGQKVLLSYRTNATEDLWLHDIARQVTEPFVSEPPSDWLAVWAPDGERVLFSSRRAGPFDLYARRVNGLGGITPVARDIAVPFGLTRDGSGLIFQGPGESVSLLTIANGSSRELWADDAAIEDARLSPDERWIVYTAVSARGPQIWLRPYPEVQSNRWPISPDGGRSPRWSMDSRTIFYRRGADMMSVHLGSAAVPTPGTPERLFGGAYQEDFDIGRDGRFLMIKEPSSASPPERRIIVVLNWFQELIARVGRR